MLSISLNPVTAGLQCGFKPIRYFVDSCFRDKVIPAPGSVLYCDLLVAVEHSGIYVGDGQISNIVVDGFAESTVRLCSAESFTSKSTLGRKIYVSCDGNGAVGDIAVSDKANSHVGDRAFYGLVINNCHQFSTKCVNQANGADRDWLSISGLTGLLLQPDWEPTLRTLKATARKKLGATKWLLWDWTADEEPDRPHEPDWDAHIDHFRHLQLDEESVERIRAELSDVIEYELEIADENIPPQVTRQLATFRQTLSDICARYEEVKPFLALCPTAKFSYSDLQACGEDFAGLAKTLQENVQIKDLARRLGRNHIDEAKKKRARIPQASKSEVHGTHRSDDVMRLLPSELLNLEDETLESLFYARLLEKNLLTYELRGHTHKNGEEETSRRTTGPVVACLDTSGSMQGAPMLKAKALLLAAANILKSENRSLHVLLFGSKGELREFSMVNKNDASGLLTFLRQGFGGGTDFETPLRRALDIIEQHADYRKADVLMISDGDCHLSDEFISTIKVRKEALDCTVYSVLCAGGRVEDQFSDTVMIL